jgi:hypothetical protein
MFSPLLSSFIFRNVTPLLSSFDAGTIRGH